MESKLLTGHGIEVLHLPREAQHGKARRGCLHRAGADQQDLARVVFQLPNALTYRGRRDVEGGRRGVE